MRRVYSVGKLVDINNGWLRHVLVIQLGLGLQSYLTSDQKQYGDFHVIPAHTKVLRYDYQITSSFLC